MSDVTGGCATVALDVGGTAIKGAVRDPAGRMTAIRRWPTPRGGDPAVVVAAVGDALAGLLQEAPAAQSVGLVVPGTVDEQGGIATFSENIGWRNVPFRDIAEAISGLPVGFGHDLRAGGLAESVLGAARGSRDVLFMPLGTGISGAMIVSGRPLDGRFGGEIGHLDVGSGRPCACGLVGRLETVATGPSIATIYGERSGTTVSGAKPVVERMLAGDDTAAGVWRDAVESIARALTSYVTLLAPELVVLGGGLSGAGDHLLTPYRTAPALGLAARASARDRRAGRPGRQRRRAPARVPGVRRGGLEQARVVNRLWDAVRRLSTLAAPDRHTLHAV